MKNCTLSRAFTVIKVIAIDLGIDNKLHNTFRGRVMFMQKMVEYAIPGKFCFFTNIITLVVLLGNNGKGFLYFHS